MNTLEQALTDAVKQRQAKYGYTDVQMQAYMQGMIDCASEGKPYLDKKNHMLRVSVSDLCEAIDLLKKANDDIAHMAGMYSYCRSCVYTERMNVGGSEVHRCTHEQECWCGEYHKWRYADAVNKLLSKHADEENEHER